MSSSLQKQPLQLNKLFYRIGEVSRLTGIRPYVLRYWETEFPQIRPEKAKSGQRIYSKKEIDSILRIKQMLYSEGYTIAGARKKLNNGAGTETDVSSVIETIKKELRDILEILK
jgi:DNA-binding transcriptional MerR regulator